MSSGKVKQLNREVKLLKEENTQLIKENIKMFQQLKQLTYLIQTLQKENK